jgi:tetratricopeptide (TPR) repeat protein
MEGDVMGIGRGIRLGVVAALGATALGLAGAATATPRQDNPTDALRALGAALEKEDCPAVVKLAVPLLKKGGLPGQAEAALDAVLADCANKAGDKARAYTYVFRGTKVPEAPDELWTARLWMEAEAKQYPAAVATVEEMSRGRGAALNSTPLNLLYLLSRSLKDAGLKAERKRLLAVLAADAYVPAETAGNAQPFQLGYARVLAEDGDAAAAQRYLAALTNARLVTEAYVDPKLRTLLPAHFDLRATAERGLARDREAADRHSERLALLIEVATDLKRLGRPQEAIELLQAAALRFADRQAFKDFDEQLPWYWDLLARANASLGRYETAAKAYATAAALKEQGQLNVSQVINMADLQVRFGHGEDALKTLAVFDEPGRKGSPYGEMELREARACAQASLGRAGAAAADLAYVQAHEKDNPTALGYVYLCLERSDDAAAFFIRRLADPDSRTDILLAFSDYDPPSAPVPPQFGGRLDRLKARPDVKTALDRAGGLRRIPLQSD